MSHSNGNRKELSSNRIAKLRCDLHGHSEFRFSNASSAKGFELTCTLCGKIYWVKSINEIDNLRIHPDTIRRLKRRMTWI